MRSLFILTFVLSLAATLAAQDKPAASQSIANPSFAAAAMDGKKIDTADLRGKIVVINLWFTNCPNCVEEIKLLNQLVNEYAGNKDVVFLGLAANRKADLEKFLAKNPFRYTIIPNATEIILTKFGTPDKNGGINVPFPMHYVLDREGKVVVKTEGIKGVAAVRKELAHQFPAK